MWFIFPQFAGLGSSDVSRFYAIKSIDEARAYLQHPILGARLIESSEAVLAVTHRSAHEIFGSPDDMKLKSCMTLFANISSAGSVFEKVLDKYYGAEQDSRTLQLIKDQTS